MMRHAVLARAVAGPRPRPVPLVALVALLALLSVAAPAASPVAELWAQAPTPRAPGAERGAWTRVRVAKWALLGATVGFGLYALSHSTRAERDYDDLRRLCVAEPASCTAMWRCIGLPENSAELCRIERQNAFIRSRCGPQSAMWREKIGPSTASARMRS